MSKYFLFSYQLLAPLMSLNISTDTFQEFISNELIQVAQVIDNQAELHFGDNQKKTSEKPEVQIKKEKKNIEIEKKKKKNRFDDVDKMITILENPPYLIEKDSEESILGKVLFNLSGTMLYGSKTEKIY